MEEVKTKLGMEDTNKNSIFEILKMEHRQVKENLNQILNENTPNEDLFQQTSDALNMHMEGEEKLLYPKLEDNDDTRRLAFTSYEEHNIVKQMIDDMGSVSTDNERWLAKIQVMKDLISHHVDVEENDIFPKAENFISDEEQANIGREYMREKTSQSP